MTAARTFLKASLIGLALTAAAGLVSPFAGNWPGAHWPAILGAIHWPLGLFGFLLPALTALHLHSVDTFVQRPAPPAQAKRIAILWLAGGAFLALGEAVHGAANVTHGHAWTILVHRAIAWLVLLAAAGMTTGMMMRILPKRGESLVNIEKDPLTKGDDASFKHVKFAHMLLPVGILFMAVAAQFQDSTWGTNLYRAGAHLFLAFYALLSCYGLTHLWVPRLSGVPAIAAGAIKGELHSSRLALLLLIPGFAFGVRGLIIAGGAFLFFGAFTWMGVLGANIMRNKSKTARVTPEFVYVPWTFTGVFWLISGILLGIFLNVVPELFADRAPGLRFAHIHIALLGGFAQILLGFSTRILPTLQNRPPVSFHRAKWGFYLLNGGLSTMLYGRILGDISGRPFQVGAVLAVLGLAAAFMSLRRNRAALGGS